MVHPTGKCEYFFFYHLWYFKWENTSCYRIFTFVTYWCLAAGRWYSLESQICLWIFYELLSYDQTASRKTAVVLQTIQTRICDILFWSREVIGDCKKERDTQRTIGIYCFFIGRRCTTFVDHRRMREWYSNGRVGRRRSAAASRRYLRARPRIYALRRVGGRGCDVTYRTQWHFFSHSTGCHFIPIHKVRVVFFHKTRPTLYETTLLLLFTSVIKTVLTWTLSFYNLKVTRHDLIS